MTNQQVALSQLQSLGYRADVVSDGAAVLRALEQRSYDVILMDVHMPGMDGLAASRTINARWPKQRRPHIIAVTANALIGHRDLCLEAGMDDYLSKPLTRDRLADALARVPRGTAASEPAPSPPLTSAPAAPARPEPAAKTSPAPAPHAGALRVLVADDNVANQQLAKAQFALLGYDIDLAGDGSEVLEAMARGPYDVVFMDVHMPRLDGLEATRMLRARLEGRSRPRIIGMTADASGEQRRLCLSAGMDDCIAKPVERQRLAALLDACRTDSG